MSRAYHAHLNHSDAQQRNEFMTYLSEKGKGMGKKGSSGKGFGRRQNPLDKDGNVMRCRLCNSTEHFAAKCPKGSSSSTSQLYQQSGSTSWAPMGEHHGIDWQPMSTFYNAEVADDNVNPIDEDTAHVFMVAGIVDWLSHAFHDQQTQPQQQMQPPSPQPSSPQHTPFPFVNGLYASHPNQ